MNAPYKPDPDLEMRLSRKLLDVLIRAGLVLALAVLCYWIFSPFIALMAWALILAVTLYPAQQKLARQIIDAGADMVIGNHAHWAGAMEVYKGKPIWYALGNFVFDQTWSEPTMEGITLELTFRGSELVQAKMRPHIILDKAQPNFLDPAGDGAVVMNQVFNASKNTLPW